MSNPSRRGRLLIVDDHPVMRRGLSQILAEVGAWELCGEADSKAAALAAIEDQRPDLVIIDISLGDESGLELIEEVKNRYPQVRMLVHSMHDEMLFAERSLRSGAMGYVNKNEPTEVLLEAISNVMSGRVHLSAAMADRVLRGAIAGDSLAERQSPLTALSNRELQVFEMIGRGLITKQIASRLGLSVKTIETYRENIKTKLKLSNSAELTREAVRWVMHNT